MIGTVPYLVLILAFVFVVAAVELHSTAFGRSLYVIGGNAEVARQAGVRVDLYRFLTYAGSGGCAAFAGRARSIRPSCPMNFVKLFSFFLSLLHRPRHTTTDSVSRRASAHNGQPNRGARPTDL